MSHSSCLSYFVGRRCLNDVIGESLIVCFRIGSRFSDAVSYANIAPNELMIIKFHYSTNVVVYCFTHKGYFFHDINCYVSHTNP